MSLLLADIRDFFTSGGYDNRLAFFLLRIIFAILSVAVTLLCILIKYYGNEKQGVGGNKTAYGPTDGGTALMRRSSSTTRRKNKFYYSE